MTTSVRECVTCGVLTDDNADVCPVCLGEEFQTRYRCEDCGALSDAALCWHCDPANRLGDATAGSVPLVPTEPQPLPGKHTFAMIGAGLGLLLALMIHVAELMGFNHDSWLAGLTAGGAFFGHLVAQEINNRPGASTRRRQLRPVALMILGGVGGAAIASLGEEYGHIPVGLVTGTLLGYLCRVLVDRWEER